MATYKLTQNNIMAIPDVFWLPLQRLRGGYQLVWIEDTADVTGLDAELVTDDVSSQLKIVKDNYVDNLMTVTISTGKTFDAHMKARQNISDGISAAATLNITSTVWRLADNTQVTITLDELKEAQALALQRYAEIKGIE